MLFRSIKQMLDLWQCPLSYIAFGDSLNDMEMFRHAAISVAMGNANAQLKEVATFVTDNVMEDGIFHACEKLNLI